MKSQPIPELPQRSWSKRKTNARTKTGCSSHFHATIGFISSTKHRTLLVKIPLVMVMVCELMIKLRFYEIGHGFHPSEVSCCKFIPKKNQNKCHEDKKIKPMKTLKLLAYYSEQEFRK
jgi:hypothetical protein